MKDLSMEGNEQLWPYVLPFPLKSEKRRLIWKILQSKVGLAIIVKIKTEGRTYQKSLIKNTPYSNKSVIKYLKYMVEGHVLVEGLEQTASKKWVKWYVPTELGKWLIMFLKLPHQISYKQRKKAIEDLFKFYSSNIVKLLQRYNFKVDVFQRILTQKYMKSVFPKVSKKPPNVTVVGSVALDIYASTERLPDPDETAILEETGRHQGGMAANVAVALARLQIPVAFIGKISSDPTGFKLLKNLHLSNVDTVGVMMSEKSSLKSVVFFDSEGKRRLFTLISPDTALSLSSKNEVDWELIDSSKIVYVGEVFLDVASEISKYAKKNGKKVIYRPGSAYLIQGVQKLKSVLENIDFLIMNSQSQMLMKSIEKEKTSPSKIAKLFGVNTIVTKGLGGCDLYSGKEKTSIPIPSNLREIRCVDSTGAGDGFSAGFIKGMLNNSTLRQSILYGQALATIACSRFGASAAFPTLEEFEAILKQAERF